MLIVTAKNAHKKELRGATFFAAASSETNFENITSFLSSQSEFYDSFKKVKDGLEENQEFKEVEFCICIIQNDFLYLLAGNGASFSLKRDGATYKLLETQKGSSKILSGRVKNGDVYELGAGKVATLEVNEVSSQEPEKSSLKEVAANIIDKILTKLPERRIIVHGEDSPGIGRAKKASIIGIIFIVILGISIFFGLKQRDKALARQEYEPTLAQAVRDYEQALELEPLSKARARELILSSHAAAKELQAKGIQDERLTKLLGDISNSLPQIAGIYQSSANLFLDLSIVASGFRGNDIAFSGGILRVLDTSAKKLVGIETANKRTNVISGSEYLPDALATTAYADRSFILSSDGLREVTEEVELVIKSEWDTANVLVAAFAGNIYVLDKGSNQVWRYQGVANGFLGKEGWMGEGYNFSLGSARDWSIDGSIWTVTDEKEILVYSQGVPIIFNITGQTSEFSNIVSIFASEESEFVYVLDKDNARIAVIRKNGQYIGEYITPELANASSVVADEEQRLLIFLADSKLYSLEAKHLGNEDNQQ